MAAQTHASLSLLRLPAELLLEVLGYVELLDLTNVAQTCRTLYGHSYDDTLWQPIVSRNLSRSITSASPLKSFRELYIAHHPYWFLPRSRIWFADCEPSGKLLISRYEPRTGTIAAYTVTATRGSHALQFWEKDREVIIHSFHPQISLDLDRPVMKLDVDSIRTGDRDINMHSKDGTPRPKYSREILMDTFAESGLYASFTLCRALPQLAIHEGSQVWPPLRFPAKSRTRNLSGDDFNSKGHRPETFSEISEQNFRLRKWVEYTGRTRSPSLVSFTSPNGLAAALGRVGPFFAARLSSSPDGGMSIRMPEDITTYSTLLESCYTPTAAKPWQGIWCGDYSGHGCEFLVIQQPDRNEERPLPEGMGFLRNWFESRRRSSDSSESSYASAQEESENPGFAAERAALAELAREVETYGGLGSSGIASGPSQHRNSHVTDYKDVPSGRLEAIKLTGDPNIPRGEYTFIAPDIGHDGFLRIADEDLFRGARVVKSAGHIAGRGFVRDQYTRSQLIMISHDRLAQFWEAFGHISYYQRVDLDALVNFQGTSMRS